MRNSRYPSTAAQRAGKAKGERGIAMISVLLVMSIVVLLAIGAIDFTEQELRAGGQSRAVGNSLYAAEAGVQFATNRLLPPRDLSAFTFNLTDGTTVQSRSRDDGAPQDIGVGGLGSPPPGYSVNIGAGFVNETFRVNVTAGATSKPTTEVEVKLGLLTPNSGI
jgi:hypothetical protein